jgi:hypothetical protein
MKFKSVPAFLFGLALFSSQAGAISDKELIEKTLAKVKLELVPQLAMGDKVPLDSKVYVIADENNLGILRQFFTISV